MEKFATGDWQTLDKLYDLNEMPIEEVMRRQFSMIKATRIQMTRAIDESIRLRPGFKRLAEVCDQIRVHFVVASYGLDFCIIHLLERAGVRPTEVHVPKARITPRGIVFTFPKLRLKDSINLKDDLVKRYKASRHKVVFVGDGTSDFPAAKSADVCFAIKGSKLAELCDRHKMQYTPITTFNPVIEYFRGTRGGQVS